MKTWRVTQMDIIGQIFIEVISIFGIDEKEADDKGLWKKFEKSLKKILRDQTGILKAGQVDE